MITAPGQISNTCLHHAGLADGEQTARAVAEGCKRVQAFARGSRRGVRTGRLVTIAQHQPGGTPKRSTTATAT